MASQWSKRRVLVTGHTGFKGSWLCEVLLSLGAKVSGLALEPDTEPALFHQLGLSKRVDHTVGDIRVEHLVRHTVARVRPDVVFHLAAQPLVRRSYRQPIETWSTNVMGTAHLLEALRQMDSLCAVVIITTDKVYENLDWEHPYRETDRLGGHDPYSASKAGTELVAASWRSAFYSCSPVRLATARAGNVIGGGDWSEDRLIPDMVRAILTQSTLRVRNRNAIRPWQHVLDPLYGYIRLADHLMQADGSQYQTSFNFGPEVSDQRSVGALVEAALTHWPGEWQDETNPQAPHEAGRLSLSIERARSLLGWAPRWDFHRSVAETVRWYRAVAEGEEPITLVRGQINMFGDLS